MISNVKIRNLYAKFAKIKLTQKIVNNILKPVKFEKNKIIKIIYHLNVYSAIKNLMKTK